MFRNKIIRFLFCACNGVTLYLIILLSSNVVIRKNGRCRAHLFIILALGQRLVTRKDFFCNEGSFLPFTLNSNNDVKVKGHVAMTITPECNGNETRGGREREERKRDPTESCKQGASQNTSAHNSATISGRLTMPPAPDTSRAAETTLYLPLPRARARDASLGSSSFWVKSPVATRKEAKKDEP